MTNESEWELRFAHKKRVFLLNFNENGTTKIQQSVIS